MKLEVQARPEKMNTASAPLPKIEIVETSLPLCAADQVRRDNWRYHVALVVTLSALVVVAIYGSFATLL